MENLLRNCLFYNSRVERVHPIDDQVTSRNTINVVWPRGELDECLDVLYQCDFNVCAIVCDNNQSNVSMFKKSSLKSLLKILERYYEVQI